MKKTEFFIVGNPKSGTTTFHNLLKAHPEISLPTFKETKYFCTDLHRESDSFHGDQVNYPIRTKEQYEKLYKKKDSKKIRGEVTPHYMFSKEAARNIYEYNSEAKIIILLREPVAFLKSLHSERVDRLNEHIEDFFEALELEKVRKAGKEIPRTVSAPSYLYYSEWANYQKEIERYVNLFSLNNIKIFFLEEIAKDERKVYKEMLEFIGVKNIDFYPRGKINRNKSKVMRSKFIWKTLKHSKSWKFVRDFIPESVYGFLDELSYKILFKPSKKDRLSQEEKQILKREYKDNVTSLNDYLNRKQLIDVNLMELWGYE
jgi:hypothetical protein